MSEAAPRFLFVPVSGTGGAGEFMRSLIVARAVRERWPDAHIHFVVNAAAAYARDLEFPRTIIEGSPTYNVAAVNEVIVRERPHVVLFDSSGRVAQYRQAKAVGASVVYVSSRFKTRWKGFRLRRMRHVDQHWIAQPRLLGSELTRWEKLKLALMRHVEVVFLDVLFETVPPARQQQLLASLGLRANEYVVLCLGSGGRYAGVSDAPNVLLAAADQVQRSTGLPCVAVLGANASAAAATPAGVQIMSTLPNGELIALLSNSKAAVVNGGSLLLQAIANRVLAVAVPVAGDQAGRIRRCVELNLVVAASLDADAIARAIVTLLEDEPRRQRLLESLQGSGLSDSRTVATGALGRLLSPAVTR